MTADAPTASFTLTLRRPQGCPRWLWWMSSSLASVTVDGHTSESRWDTTTSTPVDPGGGTVLIEHYLSGGFGWNQKAGARVLPGDHLTYRASWFPRRRRRLSPHRP